jgi:beta-galactosidase/beta-glucuronidase
MIWNTRQVAGLPTDIRTLESSLMFIEQLADAPNPQFARPGRVDLNGSWRFAFDDEGVGLVQRWFLQPERLYTKIEVPFPPESRLSGVGDTGYHSTLWYGRRFADPRSGDGFRLLLKFGAVDFHAMVWVDGNLVGEHIGGHTPFSFDISDALEDGEGDHWIVVRAFDDPLDLEQPRGKQEWQPSPHVIWYYRTSGIWQSVWLEQAPSIRLESIRWGFDPATWDVTFDAELNRPPRTEVEARIEFSFQDESLGSVAVSADARTLRGRFPLSSRQESNNSRNLLWGPGRPNLIGARIYVSASGQPVDEVHSYLGLRTIEVTPTRILINGNPVFLRLVLQQGYWPESQLAAPSPEALEKEAQLILDVGFNGARIHQKIEDPRFLYWADRKGILLWGESANAFTYSQLAIERHAAEWREAVIRDRNHPSIIAWVPFNESWGIGEVGYSAEQQGAVKAAYHRTHQLDGTRPVIGNDGWENPVGDIFTIHDYTWDPTLLTKRYGTPEAIHETVTSYFPGSRNLVVGDYDYRGKPVIVSEFGGVSYAPRADEDWFGYGKVQSPGEFVDKYGALLSALNQCTGIAGFCYTQFTDTEQETNGILTESREHKVPVKAIRPFTTGEELA